MEAAAREGRFRVPTSHIFGPSTKYQVWPPAQSILMKSYIYYHNPTEWSCQLHSRINKTRRFYVSCAWDHRHKLQLQCPIGVGLTQDSIHFFIFIKARSLVGATAGISSPPSATHSLLDFAWCFYFLFFKTQCRALLCLHSQQVTITSYWYCLPLSLHFQ